MSNATRQPATESKDQQGKTIEVDGRTVDVEQAARDHLNKQAWQQKNTQTAQRLAKEREAIEKEKASLAEAKKAAAEPPKEAPALPDPVDDGDAFNKALTNTLDDTANKAASAAEERAKEIAEATRAELQKERLRERVGQQNVELMNQVIDSQYSSLSDTERREVERRLRGMGGPDNGAIDPNSGAYVYNESAVHRAVYGVDSFRERIVAEAETKGYKDGLSGRTRGQDAMLMDQSRPAEGASDGDVVEWLRSLPAEMQGKELRQLKQSKGDGYVKGLINRAGYS